MSHVVRERCGRADEGELAGDAARSDVGTVEVEDHDAHVVHGRADGDAGDAGRLSPGAPGAGGLPEGDVRLRRPVDVDEERARDLDAGRGRDARAQGLAAGEDAAQGGEVGVRGVVRRVALQKAVDEGRRREELEEDAELRGREERGRRRRLGESIGACIFLSFIHSYPHMLRSDFAYSFTFADKQRCTCE